MFDEVLYSKTDNKGNTIKYSFYDTLSEGLSKYFDDKPHNIKGKANDMQTAANVMAKAIIVKIFGNQMFDTANIKNSKAKAVLQTMNKVSDFTFKWLNDDPWIKKETKRLFGKMLVEDNINLDIPVVFSEELPLKKDAINSLVTVPSVAGIYITSYIVNNTIKLS